MRITVYMVVASVTVAAILLVSRPLETARRPKVTATSRVLDRQAFADGSGYLDLLSDEYQLDRIYTSMEGPNSNHGLLRVVDQAGDDETIWLTGIETNVVNADDRTRISNEFFCHSNLTLSPDTTNPEMHNASFETPTHAEWRMFTLVPGRMSIQLPDGFGLPVKNGTLLDNFSMSLNQNPGEPRRRIRMETRVNFQRVVEGQPTPRPLFRRAVYVYQQHKLAKEQAILSAYKQSHQGEFCGQSCDIDQTGGTPSLFFPKDLASSRPHPGATCCVANASEGGVLEQFGAENTIHWMVPPGVHQYRTEVTEQMNLPFDTTAHYVTGHLHPFGKSLTLVDIETREEVFRIEAQCFEDRLGVEAMSEIVSHEGMPLQKGRRYELVTEYENTTDRPIDAMAILYIYVLESEASVADDSPVGS